jgi:hypothetical protein
LRGKAKADPSSGYWDFRSDGPKGPRARPRGRHGRDEYSFIIARTPCKRTLFTSLYWDEHDVGSGNDYDWMPSIWGEPGRIPSSIFKSRKMDREFVERRGTGYYIIGSHVSVDSVVYQFLQGESPEAIAQAFPSRSLVHVYGGYLSHRAEIDAYLKQGEARFGELARAAREVNPLLYAKLDAARQAMLSRS